MRTLAEFCTTKEAGKKAQEHLESMPDALFKLSEREDDADRKLRGCVCVFDGKSEAALQVVALLFMLAYGDLIGSCLADRC